MTAPVYREGLADFLDVVRQFQPPPHDIVAHSMGAAVVIDYLDVHGSEGLGDIVLLTPLVRDTLPEWVHVAGKMVAPFHDYLRFNTGDEEATDDYSLFLEADPLRSRCVSFRWGVAQNRWRDSFDTSVGRSETPFVIYGDEDVLVDNDISRTWIGKVFPHHRSATVAGGGHRLLNEVPEIREEAIGLVVESLEDGA